MNGHEIAESYASCIETKGPVRPLCKCTVITALTEFFFSLVVVSLNLLTVVPPVMAVQFKWHKTQNELDWFQIITQVLLFRSFFHV